MLRAGVVLLGALFEAFVEDLFDLCVDHAFANRPLADRKELKSHTSGKNNNASVHQVNTMFFHVGVPWIMSHPKCHWQKFSNSAVQQRLKDMAKARNEIAHGESRVIRKSQISAWREFAESLAECLDEIAGDHIQSLTGTRPW